MINSKAISKTIVVIAVIVIAIAVAVVALLPISGPTPTPTPTPTTSTPTTPESPTPTPTTPLIQPIANFKIGAYAEYIMRVSEDSTSMEGKYRLSVDGEENYKGNLCWLLSITIIQEDMKMVTTWWITKTEYEVVHGRMQMYMNDRLVMQQEFDPGEKPPEAREEPKPIDVNYATGYETITVPAGTFINCIRVEVMEAEGGIVKTWAHSSVPIWGLVKTEVYDKGELVMTMELVSYGS